MILVIVVATCNAISRFSGHLQMYHSSGHYIIYHLWLLLLVPMYLVVPSPLPLEQSDLLSLLQLEECVSVQYTTLMRLYGRQTHPLFSGGSFEGGGVRIRGETLK